MIFLFAALGNAYAQTPAQPILPQTTVNLTPPKQGTSICPTLTTGSNCIRNLPAGNATSFQNAINAATCGDTIVLAAGSTYRGNFTIPSTSCSGWIEIVSSALASLPSPGNRIGPSNLSNMGTISTPNISPAIQFLPSSNHWRLIGLEITTSYVSTVNTNYCLITAGLLADDSTAVSVQSQLPAYLIFDRIYIHGLSTTNTKRGIQMDAQSIGIVDSYCDEIHYNGNDSQCFASWNGIGPYLIQNNFVQAGAEDILFGGADPSIPNLVPSDITLIGNTIQKNVSWRGGVAPYNWQVKNLVELKNAQRVLIDGNVIQYSWVAGQVGFAILLTPRNQNGGCAWCVVQDVTITHNVIRHASSGISISGGDNEAGSSLPTSRVLIQNNVLDDISSINWGGDGRAFMILSSATTPNPHDIVIDHDTAFPNVTDLTLGDSGTVGTTSLTNNLWDYGTYGVIGNNSGVGSGSLNAYISPYTWNKIVFIRSSGSSDGNTWPPGTLWSTQAAVQFTNFASANYQLLNSSPYHNAATDGKDIGVWDWTCLNNDSAAALAGTFVPGVGCASSGTLLPQPPANLSATVQ